MNIQALAATAARIGMSLAGNAKERVTLHLRGTDGDYNPAQDDESTTGGADVALDVLPYEGENNQTGGKDVEFSPYVEKLLVEAADLPAGRTITENDTVTRADGDRWEIKHVSKPPGQAIYILDVQK